MKSVPRKPFSRRKSEQWIQRRLAAYGLLDLVEDISAKYHVSTERIVGRSKNQRVTAARHAAWSAIYERPHWSYQLIAELFEVALKTVWGGVDAHLNRQPLVRRSA